MASRTRLKVDERRQQLLDLAIDAFAHRPYDAVSIDEIAKRAGISKGLLYHYFGSKRDFYIAAVKEEARALLEATDLGPHDGGPDPTKLKEALTKYLLFVEERAEGFVFLLRGTMAGDAEVQRIVEDVRQSLVERLLSGLGVVHRSPALRHTLAGYVAFVERVSLDWLESRELTRGAVVEMLTQAGTVLVASLLAPGERITHKTGLANEA